MVNIVLFKLVTVKVKVIVIEIVIAKTDSGPSGSVTRCDIVKHWLSSHEGEREQPEFIFRKLSSFKDCRSRQIAEAILIHFSKDELLNSKNEYNSNCLARVTVEESMYERKEEEESVREKKAWNEFK